MKGARKKERGGAGGGEDEERGGLRFFFPPVEKLKGLYIYIYLNPKENFLCPGATPATSKASESRQDPCPLPLLKGKRTAKSPAGDIKQLDFSGGRDPWEDRAFSPTRLLQDVGPAALGHTMARASWSYPHPGPKLGVAGRSLGLSAT